MLTDQIMSLLSELAILLPAFVLVFTCRGFFKALAAKLMGDDTAYDEGLVSLNPLSHIDFVGLFIMLFVLFFIGGLLIGTIPRAFLFILLILVGARWAHPIPINEGNFRNHSLGIIITTLAGPFGNFFLALVFSYIISYFPYGFFPNYAVKTLIDIFRVVIELSIFFGVIDLIPIPPFDGSRLLQFILPKSLHYFIEILEKYSLFILLILFFIPGVSEVFFRILIIASVLVKKLLWYLVI